MAVYTPDQLTQYLAHISYPEASIAPSDLTLATLTTLQRLHLARIPFETISLHYSPSHLLSLDPTDLFTKIITHSRGGYCMEVNTLFGTLLRTLGFTVLPTGARVKNGPAFGGWDHAVNLVRVAGQRYLVDVGFGADGPMVPVPLRPDTEWAGVLPGQRGRLEWRALAQHADQAQRLWVYSAREGAGEAWRERYAFSELEFFADDFAVMNVRTMTARTSFFVQTVVAMRTLLEGGKTVGLLTMRGDYVKRRVGETTEMLEKLESESQRVAALRKYFFIELSESDQKAIKGLSSELRG